MRLQSRETSIPSAERWSSSVRKKSMFMNVPGIGTLGHGGNPPIAVRRTRLFVGEVDPQKGQHHQHSNEREPAGDVQARMAAAPQRLPSDPPPEEDEPGDRAE